ncbi:MAG: hypothetical protein FWE17_02200 [Alphaproteobacteria bacterium]|nr:hypothetical protein [Alphaproteobacteria bacterium]MCL2757940.1 hypothetical protein [Alphaproteobacteria bacterium]
MKEAQEPAQIVKYELDCSRTPERGGCVHTSTWPGRCALLDGCLNRAIRIQDTFIGLSDKDNDTIIIDQKNCKQCGWCYKTRCPEVKLYINGELQKKTR